MGEYSKVLSYYGHALSIWKCLLPSNHSHTQTVKGNTEVTKKKLYINKDIEKTIFLPLSLIILLYIRFSDD